MGTASILDLSANDMAFICGGEVICGDGTCRPCAVSTDSRRVGPGDMFVALAGDTFDGHDYAEAAAETGAAVLVVSRNRLDRIGDACRRISTVVAVPDTLKALQALATSHRRRFDIPLVAITGSCGKTTVKEMTASIASTELNVCCTLGNLNNEIGVPLSLLGFEPDVETGIIEMGMNHPGEIASLCAISEPTAGVITNIGRAHLEGFGSVDEVAAAKAELADFLDDTGTLFISVDDEWCRDIAGRFASRCITFGEHPMADVRAADIHAGEFTRFTLADDTEPFEMSLPGLHSVRNALAAIAVGRWLGISSEHIRAGLSNFKLPPLRMEIAKVNDATFINDSYNANPESMAAAIDVLVQWNTTCRRIAVLGDMMELGETAGKLHRDVGVHAARAGVDLLVAVGQHARETVRGARDEGMASDLCYAFTEQAAAIGFLAGYVQEPNVFLLKGSRSTKMENVLRYLKLVAEGR